MWSFPCFFLVPIRIHFFKGFRFEISLNFPFFSSCCPFLLDLCCFSVFNFSNAGIDRSVVFINISFVILKICNCFSLDQLILLLLLRLICKLIKRTPEISKFSFLFRSTHLIAIFCIFFFALICRSLHITFSLHFGCSFLLVSQSSWSIGSSCLFSEGGEFNLLDPLLMQKCATHLLIWKDADPTFYLFSIKRAVYKIFFSFII